MTAPQQTNLEWLKTCASNYRGDGVDNSFINRAAADRFDACAAVMEQLAAALKDIVPRYHACIIHGGSDKEYADIAVAEARAALAAVERRT